VDAPHVWALPFADGSAVHFVDVEHAWQLTHEDLIDTNGVNRIPVLFTGVTPLTDAAFIDHGTSVLGIVMATDNDKGILGLAPNAKGSVAPVQSPGGAVAVVAALVAIGTNPAIGAGSVVLIEQQDAQHHPVEMDLYTRHTILELTKKGITVVEAAGNGFGAGVDLDAVHQVFFGKIFDRNDGAFFDSGAVMVAASSSAVPHTRAIFSTEASNHGNRIDCYAWGENILTTQRLLDPTTNLPYTTSFPFGGTSGASAIVAGVAVVLQNIAFAVGGAFLTPGRLRDFLRDRNLNTRPAPPDDGRIGVMPDLAKLQPAILAP
jgi:subtilisin family serine protease